jgi:broad specificity phosphatase PhoE
MTTILLARHGETDWNRERRWQGHADPPLNEEGRRQASALADELAGRPLAAVYSSDLRRARETAEIVAERQGVEVVVDPDLREIDVGAWSGLTASEVEERYPEGWTRFQTGQRGHDGETYEAHSLRVVEAVRRIAEEHPDEQVLVVSHGGSLRAIQRAVLGIDAEGHDSRLRPIGNCVTLEIALREGQLRSVD